MNAPTLIGLQNHGTGDDVFFRNVQIKDLPTPSSPAPSLTVTAPANGAIVGGEVTVTGTTDGEKVVIRAGTAAREVTPSGGAFSASIPLALGANQVNVFAFNADGVGTSASRSVFSRSFGTLVGALSDPDGDDNGPGTYRYPTNEVYTAGIFDLQNVEVYTEGDNVRFVTRIRGAITNQFGGDQISHQRINVYLGSGAGSPVAAMPGTNMDVESPWSRTVVIDGRFGLAGVYAPDGSKVSGGTMSSLAQTREIVLTVPRSALGGIDLQDARYGVAMFGNAEGGEGIGNVRPVYDLAYWQNPGPDFWWITRVPVRRRRRRLDRRPKPRQRHARSERARRDRPRRPDAGAGAELAGRVPDQGADAGPDPAAGHDRADGHRHVRTRPSRPTASTGPR